MHELTRSQYPADPTPTSDPVTATYLLHGAPEEMRDLYRQDFILLYDISIRDFFRTASDRDHYREGADLLRKLIALGGKAEAEAIIACQAARRPRRPALIEELSEVRTV